MTTLETVILVKNVKKWQRFSSEGFTVDRFVTSRCLLDLIHRLDPRNEIADLKTSFVCGVYSNYLLEKLLGYM